MRLDKYLAERYNSRTKAAQAIEKGLVKVNGKSVLPSYELKETDELEFFEADESFVSNGGYKLSKALKDFAFNVRGMTFVDIGASTGGFTDCLLQNGALKVYCVDVGESQLDKSLLGKNVVVMDNCNARELKKTDFNEKIDGVVIDVSFISLTYILSAAADILENNSYIIALIKPQFELEKKNIGKNGIVKDPSDHRKAINKIIDYACKIGLNTVNLTNAPIISGKNKEYLILLKKESAPEIEKNIVFKYVKL